MQHHGIRLEPWHGANLVEPLPLADMLTTVHHSHEQNIITTKGSVTFSNIVIDNGLYWAGHKREHRQRGLTALVSRTPYMRPHRMLGSVTFQKTSRLEAPRVRAASSSARSMASNTGMSSRTTKGIVTNRVASAMPAGGTSNLDQLDSALLQGPISVGISSAIDVRHDKGHRHKQGRQRHACGGAHHTSHTHHITHHTSHIASRHVTSHTLHHFTSLHFTSHIT